MIANPSPLQLFAQAGIHSFRFFFKNLLYLIKKFQ